MKIFYDKKTFILLGVFLKLELVACKVPTYAIPKCCELIVVHSSSAWEILVFINIIFWAPSISQIQSTGLPTIFLKYNIISDDFIFPWRAA